jgi:maleate cis-trans isomerase
MFEEYVPKWKIGALVPLAVIDNHAYEFHRLAPPGVMEVMIAVGLREFSVADVERVFSDLEEKIDQLLDRDVDIVTQNGVPLPIVIGVAAHDQLISRMANYSKKPATSTVLAVAHGARDMGLKKVALANKWTEKMNAVLAEFLAREGVGVCGTVTRELTPAEFQRINTADSMKMAYDLGRRAFETNPDCDGVYIGGGAWLSEPVAVKLEQEFGKPVLCNQSAMIREVMKVLGDWQPRPGHSRLLATP